ncbi:MAG: nucleic acid-binding protein [Candidatus Methanomethylophilaceae archaeon]|jgi:endoribonuclease Nob1|nr:nucleic acid-binding protein [Candidatus Methanomethylophilaceae archaeon]NCA73825.1 nucleic acid-binding protein [Gammaproteobacteria bacterium]MDD2936324.1 nucleic acid-binding protein [Candidatus Methanomethylophilaceae archaeon]MDD3350861.1 nucleic acid-binding protein [Candidatus Methanomethylophilaceae archaeon]MDD3986651.1 nucleic acid-binding protein [Candidatus Methanomethylophilaceae archaeon]
MLIMDTSAFFTMDWIPKEDFLCPPGIVEELQRFDDPRLALWDDRLRVSDCTRQSLERVKEEARKTGDLGRLSPVDLTVLALALDTGGTIMTDDYSIQNVARSMGMPYRAVGTAGITKKFKWNYRCIGCGKWFKERSDECPICGSAMRAHRKK